MKTVNDPRLPKAQLIWCRWQWFWFRNRDYKFMKTRGANFFECWIGPVNIGWRRPWLEGPARVHLETLK